MLNPLHTAAVRYAKAGQPVLPVWWIKDDGDCACPTDNCRSAGKHPLGSVVPNGVNDATTDVATIAEWWERYPRANIGIAMGSVSGVLALDIDAGTDGEARIKDLAANNGGWPNTRTALTGGGGMHYLFRFDQALRSRLQADGREIPNKAGIGVKGIDVKGGRVVQGATKRGLILVEPSVHKSGRSYKWINDADPVDLPDWLYELITRPIPARGSAVLPPPRVHTGTAERVWITKALDGICTTIRTNGGKGRHAELNKGAFLMGGYIAGGAPITESEARAELIGAGLDAYEGRDERVTETVNDGLRDGASQAIAWPPAGWEERAARRVVPDPPAYFDEMPPPDDSDLEPRGKVHYLHTPAGRSGGGNAQPKPDEMPRARKAVWEDPEDLTKNGKPVIVVNDGQPGERIQKAWDIIDARNRETPTMFMVGGNLAEIARAQIRLPGGIDTEVVKLKMLSESGIKGHLYNHISWMKRAKPAKGEQTESDTVLINADGLPADLATVMVASPDLRLPVVEQVVYSPTFAADGTLLDAPGYHASERIWYEASAPLERHAMTLDEARAALYEWLVDFPFHDGGDDNGGLSSRAHAICLFLLPFVRNLIRGATPMHLVAAPTPGTGKSRLARILLSASMGREAPSAGLRSNDEAETEKLITSMLSEGRMVFFLDNIKFAIDSPSLERMLTQPTWAGRLLGTNVTVDVAIRILSVMTVNNPSMSRDLVDRSLQIRIARMSGQKWDPFVDAAHPDIIGWTQANRSRLVSAAITLVEAWQAAGMPGSKERLDRFEEWSNVLGGILGVAGIPGFLEGRQQFEQSADENVLDWIELVKAWINPPAEHRSPRGALSELATPGELAALAESMGLFGRLLGRAQNDRSRDTILGCELRKKVDNIIQGHRIIAKRGDKARGYALVKL